MGYLGTGRNIVAWDVLLRHELEETSRLGNGEQGRECMFLALCKQREGSDPERVEH